MVVVGIGVVVVEAVAVWSRGYKRYKGYKGYKRYKEVVR